MPNQNLFSEFASTSKSDWLARIEKDLKGRPISELNWNLSELEISPFAHDDDFTEALEPVVQPISNNWEIGETVSIINNDFKEANKKALTALMGGANSIEFLSSDFPSETDLATLLQGIELDYISTYFNSASNSANSIAFLTSFENIALSDGKNPLILRGGLIVSDDLQLALIQWVTTHLPLFKVVNINAGQYFKGSENVVEELFNTLKEGQKSLTSLLNQGIDIEKIHATLAFNFEIGVSYFIEIAKLRAFKLLWGNLLEAYDYPPSVPNIRAFTSVATQVDDVHTNKIRATTQAMSAILGGVSALYIAPSDDIKQSASDFSRRIARNIQNLLQMESYLDRVNDPSAGSYYIEALTQQIAEKVWGKLQNDGQSE